MTRKNNIQDMSITEQLAYIKDAMCEDYCKYTEQYRACYKDPEEGEERKIADMCHFCPLCRL